MHIIRNGPQLRGEMFQPKPWYQFNAAKEKDADEVEILIYGEIGGGWFGEGITAAGFVKELATVKAKTLNVRINSIGGSVFEGLAIFNALQRHDARVITHVDGLAASIASVIALAGAEVRIAANAFLMVHNPFACICGNAGDLRSLADALDKVAGSLVGAYAAKTGKSEDTIRGWLDAETWFNAEEAKEHGFADSITEAATVKALADLSAFTNVPRELAARYTPKIEEPPAETEPAVPSPSLELLHLAAASLNTLERSRLLIR